MRFACRIQFLFFNHISLLSSPSKTGQVRFASPLELARSAHMQCLVGTTTSAHHCCWRSRFSCHNRALGGTDKHKGFSRRGCLSLRNHEGRDYLSPYSNLPLVYHRLFASYHCLLVPISLRIPWDEPILVRQCTKRQDLHDSQGLGSPVYVCIYEHIVFQNSATNTLASDFSSRKERKQVIINIFFES